MATEQWRALWDSFWTTNDTVVAEDIPWPSEHCSIIGVKSGDSAASKKKKLRQALLTFHPDKFQSRILPKVAEKDRGEVIGRIKGVTQRLMAEKEREGL